MKTYKRYFLLMIAGIFAACSNDSEEPLVGNWTIVGSFDGSERGHAASFILRLDDGKEYGYVCCGSNGRVCRSEVYRYDPSRGTWAVQSVFPGKARTQAVGFSVDGKGYIGTGWDSREDVMRDFWEFDPYGAPRGVWTEVAPLPDETEERHSAIAFSLFVAGKQYGYVGTGFTDGNERMVLKNFWRFDPDQTTTVVRDDVPVELKGRWEEVEGNPGNKRYGATAFVIDNKAYICAGYSSVSNAYARDLLVFNPNATDEGDDKIWTEKRKMYDADPDQDYDDEYNGLARAFPASFAMPGGDDGLMKGYLVAGNGVPTVWEYDPIEDLWVQRTRLCSSNISISKGGATAFSFLEELHPVKHILGRSFVLLGLSGTVPYDDVREWFPLEEDNLRDDER